MAETRTTFSRKLPISRMLFKSRDEKRIFGIMNFQKKSRNGNEKKYLREFDALEMLLETVAKFWNKMSKRTTKNLAN
jgi:hypothetical protein